MPGGGGFFSFETGLTMTQFSSFFLNVTGGTRGGAGVEVEVAGAGHGDSGVRGV